MVLRLVIYTSVAGLHIVSDKLVHDLAKQLSYYLYFFFSWTYYIGRSVGKCHIMSHHVT